MSWSLNEHTLDDDDDGCGDVGRTNANAMTFNSLIYYHLLLFILHVECAISVIWKWSIFDWDKTASVCVAKFLTNKKVIHESWWFFFHWLEQSSVTSCFCYSFVKFRQLIRLTHGCYCCCRCCWSLELWFQAEECWISNDRTHKYISKNTAH